MKLNKEQIEAEARLLQFFESPKEQVVIVLGPGGSGKTSSVVEFTKKHRKLLKRVVLCAPTNAATGVLKKFSQAIGELLPTKTTHQLLGLIVGKDGEDKKSFRANDGCFDDFDTIVLDEGSMASEVLCRNLEERLQERRNVKIIVMMDPCQLNPVNEKATRIVDFGHNIWLKQDMRSGNGPLLQVKREVRDFTLARMNGDLSKDLKIEFDTRLDETDSGVHLLKGKFFDDAMLDMFDSEQYRNDPNFVRALAWTNAEVDRMNRIIRWRIYGKGCDPYIVGERMCVLSPVYDSDNIPIFSTDDEAIVEKIEVASYLDHMDRDNEDNSYPVWRVTLRDPWSGTTVDVPVLHEDGMRKFNRRQNFLAEEALAERRPWGSFHDFKDMFCRIRPAHALTVHKSQGQTFGCVFVNFKDLMKNKSHVERARLHYVAISRPTTDIVTNLKTIY